MYLVSSKLLSATTVTILIINDGGEDHHIVNKSPCTD